MNFDDMARASMEIDRMDLDAAMQGRAHAHETITQLRAYALGFDHPGPVAQACARGRVKRRVAKRWATRVLRTWLPRIARLTGPWRARRRP